MKRMPDPQEVQLLAGMSRGASGWGHDPDPLLTHSDGALREVAAAAGDQRRCYEGVVAAATGSAENPVRPIDALVVMAIVEAAAISSTLARSVVPPLTEAEREAFAAGWRLGLNPADALDRRRWLTAPRLHPSRRSRAVDSAPTGMVANASMEARMNRTVQMIVQPGRQVVRDFWANRRTGATFLIIIALFSLASATIFWAVERQAWASAHAADSDVVPLTFGRAVYFTAMNVTTVGFGDVFPRTSWGECIAVINGLAGLVMFGFLVAAATAALQPSSTSSGPEEGTAAENARGSEAEQSRDSPVRSGAEEGSASDPVDDLLQAVQRLVDPARRSVIDTEISILDGDDLRERSWTTVHVVVGVRTRSRTDIDA